MHNENWDDLRFVLAVAETGSVLQAAKRLNVNHATVLRRIGAFEERHATVMFERTAQGYRLLPDRAHVIRAAQEAEAALEQVHRLASGAEGAVRGTVRLTSTDSMCLSILPEFAARLAQRMSTVKLSILSSNAHIDLIRDQAHIAIRPAKVLPDELQGEQVGELGFGAYKAKGAPDIWIRLAGPLSRSIAADWLRAEQAASTLGVGADSFLTIRECAAAGQGIGILPRFLGDKDTRLVRLPDALEDLTVPIWVARHADALDAQNVRAVQTRLVAYLKEKAVDLRGAL